MVGRGVYEVIAENLRLDEAESTDIGVVQNVIDLIDLQINDDQDPSETVSNHLKDLKESLKSPAYPSVATKTLEPIFDLEPKEYTDKSTDWIDKSVEVFRQNINAKEMTIAKYTGTLIQVLRHIQRRQIFGGLRL